MSTTAKFGKLAIIVAAVIVFSAFFIPAGSAQSAVSHDKLLKMGGLNVAYHYLSESEMQNLQKVVGVRNPNKNYNQIIDGHGTGLAPPSETDWKDMVHHVKVVDSISGLRATRASMDLSKEKYFPPIGNQGQQGSCASWAVNYYAHTILEAEAHNWDAASGNRSYLMSPAWTYNMIDSGVDQGSTFVDNAKVLQNWGSASMATMPYFDNIDQGIGGPRAMREAPQYKIKNYYILNNTGESMINEIKTLIDQGTPVTFAIDADVYKSAFSDGNYIISSQEYSADLQPNHGQTIIGYNDFITDDGDVGAFKIANSWGSGWGDHGFYWITYKAFYTEVDYDNQAVPMYMTVEHDYQPKLLGVWENNGTMEMNVNISFGMQTSSGYQWLKVFYNHEMPGVHVSFPQVMIFDLTPLYQYYEAGATNITLRITNTSAENGNIYQFYVEKYASPYVPGHPQEMSPNAGGLPASFPCNVSVDFKPYTPISFGAAMDTNLLTFPNYTASQTGWVSVPYAHYEGSSAVRTTLVGPEPSTAGKAVLAARVTAGPGLMTFYWKISAGQDEKLSFYENNTLKATISGQTNWTKVSVLIGAGTRNLYWVYSKSGSIVSGEDSAWVDAISWEQRSDKVPTAPTNAKAKVGTGYVDLSWGPATASSSAPILDYGIFRGNSTQNMTLVAKVDANTTAYNDTMVTNGQLYYYTIKAENYVGFSKGTDIIKALPAEFPYNPTDLKANSTFGGTNLTWKAPSNAKAAGLSNYTVYRALNGTNNFVKVGAAPATQLWFNDTSAAKGKKYDYYVVAVNWMGQSKKSNTVTGMAYGTPYAPQDVKEKDGSGYVEITWTKPTNDGGAPITGYVIYRKAPGKEFVKVGEVNGNTYKFKDTSVKNNQEYVYVVVAVNKFGEGNKSMEVNAHPADIIINIGSNTVHMQYTMFGGIIAVIVLAIVGLVLLAKRRKKNAKAQKDEQEPEPSDEGASEEPESEAVDESEPADAPEEPENAPDEPEEQNED